MQACSSSRDCYTTAKQRQLLKVYAERRDYTLVLLPQVRLLSSSFVLRYEVLSVKIAHCLKFARNLRPQGSKKVLVLA
jgi:hypothetical protein